MERERYIYIQNILIYPVYLQFTLYTQVVVLRGASTLDAANVLSTLYSQQMCRIVQDFGWVGGGSLAFLPAIPQFEHKV